MDSEQRIPIRRNKQRLFFPFFISARKICLRGIFKGAGYLLEESLRKKILELAGGRPSKGIFGKCYTLECNAICNGKNSLRYSGFCSDYGKWLTRHASKHGKGLIHFVLAFPKAPLWPPFHRQFMRSGRQRLFPSKIYWGIWFYAKHRSYWNL